MNENLISQYVNKITYNDISAFAKKNNVILNDEELKLVYSKIKTSYKTIIYGNPQNIFNELKSKINNDSYNKIINLYNEFKAKYRGLF